MATPKKPGARRDRPRKNVEAAPKKKLGRPPIPFLNDPDRYLVAMMDAHALVNNTSEIEAAKFIAAMQVGHRVEVPPEIAAKTPSGSVAIGWGPSHKPRADDAFINTRGGSRASTIEGRAATLREKARESKKDPAAVEWRSAMIGAFALTMLPIKNAAQAKDIALFLAARAGETVYATTTIFHMIDMAAVHENNP